MHVFEVLWKLDAYARKVAVLSVAKVHGLRKETKKFICGTALQLLMGVSGSSSLKESSTLKQHAQNLRHCIKYIF